MKVVLFSFVLFFAIASVQAIKLPTAFRPGLTLASNCYEALNVLGATTFQFKWNTTADSKLRANVYAWQLQISDLATFKGGSQWWTDTTVPGHIYNWDSVFGSGAIRCWTQLYFRVRAVATTGQTGPWSAVGTSKRGGMIPAKTSNIIIRAVGDGRINIAAV